MATESTQVNTGDLPDPCPFIARYARFLYGGGESPASQSGSAGSTMAYAVDITNTDDSACASGTFSVGHSMPGGLTASVKRKQVSPSWNASTDNVGVSGYRVMRNGIMLANTPDTSYNDRDISAGSTYSYHVVAYDMGLEITDGFDPG